MRNITNSLSADVKTNRISQANEKAASQALKQEIKAAVKQAFFELDYNRSRPIVPFGKVATHEETFLTETKTANQIDVMATFSIAPRGKDYEKEKFGVLEGIYDAATKRFTELKFTNSRTDRVYIGRPSSNSTVRG